MATLAELRSKHNLSQAELSLKANVGISVISSIENGKPVSKRSIERICAFFEVEKLDEVVLLPRKVGMNRERQDDRIA